MLSIKKIVKNILPNQIKKFIWYYLKLKGLSNEKSNSRKIKEIKEKGYVNILFIVCSLPMWRYQSVVDAISKDVRFRFKVIYSPILRRAEEEAYSEEIKLREYFTEHKVDFVSVRELGNELKNWMENERFDLIFYCQPYPNFHNNCLNYEANRDKLWGYIDYALMTTGEEWGYNTEFHNLAWRSYQPTNMHLLTYKRLNAHSGKNVVIAGEPNSEKYLNKPESNPWKSISDGIVRKRIIWAPHFSIGADDMLRRNSFIWLNEFMIDFAKRYKDKIQIAFKPHPHLYSVLCKHKDWGKKKTDEYYNSWVNLENGQLELGLFTDLFLTSDAIIHDCGSFTGEYLFTKKPAMFVTTRLRETYDALNEFGKKCLDNYYIGQNIDDVSGFIEKVVLNNYDDKKEARIKFYNNHLLPSNGKTVGENVYEDMCKAFGFNPTVSGQKAESR